jgi:hypothetical protein
VRAAHLARASSATDHAARFRAARAHAALDELMRRRPSALGYASGALVVFAFLVAFSVGTGAMTLGIGCVLAGMAFVHGLAFVFGLSMLVTFGVRMAHFHTATLERRLARIVKERSTTVTSHATLEDEDRQRREYTVRRALAACIAPDDVGVAYVKDDVLLDFQRLDV